MFYLTSKFHDNSVNTFGFIGEKTNIPAQELRKSPGGTELRQKIINDTGSLKIVHKLIESDCH